MVLGRPDYIHFFKRGKNFALLLQKDFMFLHIKKESAHSAEKWEARRQENDLNSKLKQ
jgi:hypothetical protein